jgi:hypothetical protein
LSVTANQVVSLALAGAATIGAVSASAQTFAGVKTFSSDPLIPDEAYDATTWDGSLEPPTKNAVRDKIESMPTINGHAIKEEGGAALTQRANLNFVGGTVTATDDAGNNAKVITIAGGSLGNPFEVPGVLAVVAEAAPQWLVTGDTTINSWYIACDTLGTASSTIVDIHKNGTTIFTDQANRPTLAFNDGNGWAVSGVPDFVDFVAGDILTIDIDQVATGAADLVVMPQGTATADVVVSDTAYDATDWDGVTTIAPSKNAIRDKIESMGGGALVLLEQHTASASASLDFTAFISATYDEYQFEFVNLIPATTNGILQIKMSEDGGSTYASGTSYKYAAFYTGIGDNLTTITSTGAAAIDLARSTSTQANYSTHGSLKLFNPASAALYKDTMSQVINVVITGNTYIWTSHGTYLSAAAVNAVRFIFSSGDIASGTIRAYGVAK